MAFDRKAFRAQMERPELEWSVAHLASAAGIAGRTIYSWLAGTTRPYRRDFEQVMKVLAFERCPCCSGLGYVDPSDRRAHHRKEQAS
jgi:hypothetical protein